MTNLSSANAIQDLPKGADEQWRTKAKQHVGWVKQKVAKEKGFLKTFLSQLEAVAPKEFQEVTNEETDNM